MVGIIDRSVFIIIIFKREPLFLFFFFFFFEGEDKSVERNYFWIVATGKITGTLTRFEREFLKTIIFYERVYTENIALDSKTIDSNQLGLDPWIRRDTVERRIIRIILCPLIASAYK